MIKMFLCFLRNLTLAIKFFIPTVLKLFKDVPLMFCFPVKATLPINRSLNPITNGCRKGTGPGWGCLDSLSD